MQMLQVAEKSSRERGPPLLVVSAWLLGARLAGTSSAAGQPAGGVSGVRACPPLLRVLPYRQQQPGRQS